MKLNNYFKNIMLFVVLISAPLTPFWVNSPDTLCQWLKDNITYQYDKEDYWKTPEETVRDKSGDCEDMALLSKTVLKKLGYNVYLIILIPRKNSDSGHAICIFQEKDKTYSLFDNQYYYDIHYKNWKNILDNYFYNYKKAYNCYAKNKCQEIYTIKGEKDVK